MKELIIATKNPGKLQEMQQGLTQTNIRLIGINSEIAAPLENGQSYQENALIKAKYYAEKSGQPVIADDGGLNLLAYPNILGLHTSRFFQGKTDHEKNQEILALFATDSRLDTSATLNATLAYYHPQTKMQLIVAKQLQGQIVPEQGLLGYGFDRIFYLPKLGKTLAELPNNQRNALSPRIQALKELIKQLEALNDV